MEVQSTIYEALDPRRLLWHYTSWEGLEGILRSKSLWASRIDCLNDSSEFQHAVGVFVDEIRRRHQLRFGTDLPYEADVQIRNTMKRATTTDVCIASFSSLYDDLSQWRAYSGTGPGIALGFDPDDLAEAASMNLATLQRCTYDDSSQRDLLASIANQVFHQWPEQQSVKETYEQGIRKAVESILRVFAVLGPRMKDAAFNAENEWRIIVDRESPIAPGWGFRRRGAMVVPYRAVKLEDSAQELCALSSVLIGPHAHVDQTMTAASLLLQAHQRKWTICRTSVPFRNW
jgi:hypothetical protein